MSGRDKETPYFFLKEWVAIATSDIPSARGQIGSRVAKIKSFLRELATVGCQGLADRKTPLSPSTIKVQSPKVAGKNPAICNAVFIRHYAAMAAEDCYLFNCVYGIAACTTSSHQLTAH
jgi:hypothetical protein